VFRRKVQGRMKQKVPPKRCGFAVLHIFVRKKFLTNWLGIEAGPFY
jgi:hypothetical protein